MKDDQGGSWTGGKFDIILRDRSSTNQITVETSSADGFPFVGPVPNRAGHFIAAGFAGHGTHLMLTTEPEEN